MAGSIPAKCTICITGPQMYNHHDTPEICSYLSFLLRHEVHKAKATMAARSFLQWQTKASDSTICPAKEPEIHQEVAQNEGFFLLCNVLKTITKQWAESHQINPQSQPIHALENWWGHSTRDSQQQSKTCKYHMYHNTSGHSKKADDKPTDTSCMSKLTNKAQCFRNRHSFFALWLSFSPVQPCHRQQWSCTALATKSVKIVKAEDLLTDCAVNVIVSLLHCSAGNT